MMFDPTAQQPVLPPAPNLLTSLAWLPADLAGQYEIERYLVACTVGAWLWDILLGLSTDIQMFRKKRFGLPGAAFVLSRILSGGFLIGIFLFLIAPLRNCKIVIKVVTSLVALALPTNSFLFFLRVRAVFLQSPYVVWAFFALWLTTFASITLPFSFEAIQLGPTRWCINSVVREYSAATFVTIFVFDTSVFLAISFKITIHSMADDFRGRVNAFTTGRGIGYISRVLLRTGQLYYLATVSVNLVAMTLLLHPSLSKVYQGMFTVPSVALQNAMACRVYRLLKLGVISDIPTNVPYSSAFRSASHTHLSTMQFHAIDGNHTGNLDPYAMAGNNAIRITFHDEVVADTEELSDHNAGVGKVEDHP
ncbi:hypothetical protein QCA50_017745 [Cerrena zonata]|uniref:Uncharacterized protein n=1 Tax=Cerrena zonata TaxID=2478898 RepID=A0AAW0FPE1_9APHY